MKQNQIISNDAQAVNFREICMGGIAPNTLYRSSHPIKGIIPQGKPCTSRLRRLSAANRGVLNLSFPHSLDHVHASTDAISLRSSIKDNYQENTIALLSANAGIAAVLNLHDTHSGILKKASITPWYNELLKNNRVIALDMDFRHNSDDFRKKLKKGLRFIIKTEPPWLIHCHAGVDRTGFVSMVLEAFMGATVKEIIDDYLFSFNSIFDSDIYGEVNKTDSKVAMHLLSAISDSEAIDDQNIERIAENYLRNVIKLSEEEVGVLREKLGGV